MVKQLQFRDAIDFASPEMVFKFLFEDDAFVKFYHREVNDDPNASATAWTDGDDCKHRAVTFKPSFSIPWPALQGILGGDLSPVTETQEYRRVDNTFIIHSKLLATFPGGLTVITTWETRLLPFGKGCAIVVEGTLEIEIQLWLMQAPIENYAASAAEHAFKRLLNLARVFCERRMGIKEEHLLDATHLHSDANISPEGDVLNSDVKPSDEEEALPVPEVDGSQVGAPATSRVWFLWVLWKSFCANIRRNLESSTDFGRECLLLRQSKFYYRAWTSFGLGIAAGLILGFLSRKHLNKR